MLAAVEAGGTTFVVATGRAPDGAVDVVERYEVLTGSPDETLEQIITWLKKRGPFDGLGIASFGPVDLRVDSSTFGHITTTPKPNWAHTDLLGPVRTAVDCPVGFDTDVNAPALFYARQKGLHSCAYITVGTGVGVGIFSDGHAVHGALHPELGHIRVPKHEDDTYEGGCPFHRDCVEGMVGAQHIASRFGCAPSELAAQADDSEVWLWVAHYVAHLCLTVTLAVAPQAIQLGGGVAQNARIISEVRKKVEELLNGYLQFSEVSDMSSFIVAAPPDAGLMGAFELARCAQEVQPPS